MTRRHVEDVDSYWFSFIVAVVALVILLRGCA